MLQTSDPYLTITDNSGSFGVLMIDSLKENLTDPYTVSVSPSCPQGHNASLRIIAIDGAFADTFDFNLVVGSYHYLVWNPDLTPTSGQTINNLLSANGFTGTVTSNLLAEPTIEIYRSIFICCGIYPNNYRIGANSPEANAIINYLNNGGRVYLEGGEVWYYDPISGGHSFSSLFGLVGVSDGTGDMGPVVGNMLSFTNGMNFTYSGENSYMDHINAAGGFLVFQDGNNSYNCGVAYNQGTYRTIGTSFEIGSLVDGTAPSTKSILLDSIMKFFGITLTGIEEPTIENNTLNFVNMTICPNLLKRGEHIYIQYMSPVSENANLKVYNTSGRCVQNIRIDKTNTVNRIVWNGTDDQGQVLPAGIYFINLDINNHKITKRVILVN